MRLWCLFALAITAGAGSAPAYGQQIGGSDGILTPDSRYLAFVRAADGSAGVFVFDLWTGEETLVSGAGPGTTVQGASGIGPEPWASGDGAAISISDDGRFVAFPSYAALGDGDADTMLDVYVRDRVLGTTWRASAGVGGAAANGVSWAPRLSGDGRYVAFASAASNLVPGDTNGVEDVFLFDRLTRTTTRLSVSTAGTQADHASIRPAISADGAVVAFVSHASTLAPDAPECPMAGPPSPLEPRCGQVFVRDRTAGTTERISFMVPGRSMTNADLSADGRVVAGLGGLAEPSFFVRDRVSGRWLRSGAHRAMRSEDGTDSYAPSSLDLSADGHYVAVGPNLWGGPTDAYPTTYVYAVPRETPAGPRNRGVDETIASERLRMVTLSGNGLLCLQSSRSRGEGYVRFHLRDLESDGMLDVWERFFGLNPFAVDGAADADGDGVSNEREYAVGGNPTGGVFRYMAESAYGSWFRTTYAIFNPNDGEARVALRYVSTGTAGDAGTILRLRPWEHQLVDLEPLIAGAFAAVVESNLPLVVERTMSWDGTGFGTHAETARETASTTWFFAEGATGDGFDLFYLLFNPTATDADVTITYMRPAPATPIVKRHRVPASTRLTIHVDDEDPGLAGGDVAARIVSDQPVLAERAMYLTTGGVLFAAGHAGAGLASAAPRWYLAEGATGSYFDTFLLVLNPAAHEARIRVTYVLPRGEPLVKDYVVGRESRLTIAVDGEDERLAGTALSAIVEAIDGTPVVVERAMWWPSGAWHEGHASAGATATGRRWAFANGDLSSIPGSASSESYQATFLLILNTSDFSGTANVRVTANCIPRCGPRAVPLPANSRVTVPLSALIPEVRGATHFGIWVESDGPEIVVERAIYTDAGGVTWAAGSVVMGTRLPDP